MSKWTSKKAYEDITYATKNGVARIAFNRPEVRNAFRPKTVFELYEALLDAKEDNSIGVVLLSGEGPSPKDGVWAFCSGGDQRVRAKTGYKAEDGIPRLNILEVQRLIRFMPKVVIAVVPGWAVGGGYSLHVTCDLHLRAKNMPSLSKLIPMLQVLMGVWLSLPCPSSGTKKSSGNFFLRQKLFGSRSLRNGND